MGSFCGAPPPPAPDGTIDHWLLCDECVDGELDSVLILGSDAVPTLVNTLDGPPPDRVENMRDQLTTQYARVVASVAPANPTLTEAEYVRYYLGNHRAGYQIRSAIALGRIATDDAIGALQDALLVPTFRADVVDAIRASLVSVIVDSTSPTSAPVGSAVPARVRVIDQRGDPVPGITVFFVVSGGRGTVVPVDTITDANGMTGAEWTLGPELGAQTLGAFTKEEELQISVSATSFGTVGILLTPISPLEQEAEVGDRVSQPPLLLVTDGMGNPRAGIDVFFTVLSGGGVVVSTGTSDGEGLVRVPSWEVGPASGLNALRAMAASGAGNAVEFRAVAGPSRPSSVSIYQGNGQTGPAGAPVAVAPGAQLRDRFNRPIAGVEVRFIVLAGGGSVTGATTFTDASGRATVGSWILGNEDRGNNRLRARVRGIRGAVFTAQVVP